MSEAALSSSPTKSLSSWWRNFKTGRGEGYEGHEGHMGLQPPKRPNLSRSSASSSAVPGLPASRSSEHKESNYGLAIPPQYMDSPIFGVPLNISLRYANVTISLADRSGENFVYGHVPIIIAKCAVFLKQNARETQGIFRIPGSVRRIRMLQDLFNTPPTFGKDLDWTGFTVHDAANLLKRYLAMLPDPVIPRQKYASFREPLQTRFLEIRDYMNYHSAPAPSSLAASAQAAAGVHSPQDQNQSQQNNGQTAPHTGLSSEASPTGAANAEENQPLPTPPPQISEEQREEAITVYENMIFALPKSSRQLLLYLIDLLSVFTAQSDSNRMTAYNLAAIFQPSVLTIREHDMNPEESHISRIVIEFLILNSTALLKRVQEKAIVIHELRKENSQQGSASSGVPSLKVDSAQQSPQDTLHKSSEEDAGSLEAGQDDHANSNRRTSPPIRISTDTIVEEGVKDYSPLDDYNSRDLPPFMVSAPPADNATDSLHITKSGASSTAFVQSHTRRHSKSLSTPKPPSLQFDEAPGNQSKLGFLRRQRSTRTRSPSEETTNSQRTAPGSSESTGPAHDTFNESHIPRRQNTRSPPAGDEDRKSRFRRSLMVLLPGRDSSDAASPSSSRNTSPSRPEMTRSPSWFSRLSGSRSPDA